MVFSDVDMKPRVMRITVYLSLLISSSIFAAEVPGQKPEICEVKGLRKPSFVLVFSSPGQMLGLKVTVPRKNHTDENLKLLAAYIKQKYCKETGIIVQVFDNKKDAREFSVYGVNQIPDTERAIYYLDRDKHVEYLVRVKVIDNSQVETPIEITKP